jgi:hypothetical protein
MVRLLTTKVKVNKVELLGNELVNGAEIYKLKVALKNGDILIVYLPVLMKPLSSSATQSPSQSGDPTLSLLGTRGAAT